MSQRCSNPLSSKLSQSTTFGFGLRPPGQNGSADTGLPMPNRAINTSVEPQAAASRFRATPVGARTSAAATMKYRDCPLIGSPRTHRVDSILAIVEDLAGRGQLRPHVA